MRYLGLILVGLIFSVSSFAQSKTPAQPELESGTIESQFTYIIEKSSSFKDFQLIRKTSILKVKSNALDSLKTLRKKAQSNASETNQLNSQITSLKSEVSTMKEEITNLEDDIDSISVFGNNIEKSLYNTILWTVVIVLLALLVFFAMRFKSSVSLTKKTKKELEKVELEYEEHRKKSLKKEQEIMRKLQDEINKNNP